LNKREAFLEKEKSEEKACGLLPYWAREILKMWEDAEKKNRARKSSLPEGS